MRSRSDKAEFRDRLFERSDVRRNLGVALLLVVVLTVALYAIFFMTTPEGEGPSTIQRAIGGGAPILIAMAVFYAMTAKARAEVRASMADASGQRPG